MPAHALVPSPTQVDAEFRLIDALGALDSLEAALVRLA
jgi:hypothetical protein